MVTNAAQVQDEANCEHCDREVEVCDLELCVNCSMELCYTCIDEVAHPCVEDDDDEG